MEKILVVDDDKAVRTIIARQLVRQGFECRQAGNANEATEVLKQEPFALVLCDVHMPGMSGVDLAGEITHRYPDTAVVMVTGEDSVGFASIAQDNGACGYVLKPFGSAELSIAVGGALRRRRSETELRRNLIALEETVCSRTNGLTRAMERLHSSERALGRVVTRLGSGTERVGRTSGMIARALGWAPDRCELIRHATALGDMGLPGTGSALLEMAATIALTHHERFDGTGYPSGLSGASIPLEGAIVALAGAYDDFRCSLGHSQAVAIVCDGRETRFDPGVLDAFLMIGEQVEALYAPDEAS